MTKVFNVKGIYAASLRDSLEDTFGIELEFLFAPSTYQFREMCSKVRSVNQKLETKPSLMQIRAWSRFYFLDKIKWFVSDAVEDGILDELVLSPMTTELLYKMKSEFESLFVNMSIMGYVESSPLNRVGIHHNIELYDLTGHQFYRFMKLSTVLKGLLAKVSNRAHLATDKSDMDFFIGDRWGHYASQDKVTKYEAFIQILVEGFKKKKETTLLGVRVYPDGRPLIEVMWYGSTFNVDTFYTQIEFTRSLKHYAKGVETLSQRKYIEYLVNHKHNFPYLYKFVEDQCEEFSITQFANAEIGIIT